ncbi:hypothetical protein COBT_000881 [Conglomerata obtusa]
MALTHIEKAKKTFQRNTIPKIYLRENEIIHIKEFLQGKENILHICGNPGTGKTCTTQFVLRRRKYTYINYLENVKAVANIYKTKDKIIVIDEFDKFFITKKNECLKFFDFILKNKKKLITLSNSLDIHDNVFFFNAYNAHEIKLIVKQKIQDEIGFKIVNDDVFDILSRKIGSSGDIRKVFEQIKNICDKKINDNKSDELINLNDMQFNENKCYLQENLHHEIVKKLFNKKENTKTNNYEVYLTQCKEYKITPLDRNDFMIIYNIFI